MGIVRQPAFFCSAWWMLVAASGCNGPADPAKSLALPDLQAIPVAKGWARTSVNTTIFRHDGITTYGDLQYVAFYDAEQRVVLAQRKLGSRAWNFKRTQFKGVCKDAHNSISLAVDGDGFIHMSWDQHSQPLRYCRSIAHSSLELTDEMPMTGVNEKKVTYPEFHRLPNGDLLFAYRYGGSGRGNLALNLYDVKTRRWTQVHDQVIAGEGVRSPYWQMALDSHGTLHLSWVWRESPDVASNHDMAYAKSVDAGKTWLKSNGEAYQLPITADTAEYAAHIGPEHELINQTSMCADENGNPLVATYWRPEGLKVPQFFVIYRDGTNWKTSQVTRRTTAFSLSGTGTKAIPISRPQIVVEAQGGQNKVFVFFRDAERQSRVTVAVCDDLVRGEWRQQDLTTESVGMWEPSYDTELWARAKVLDIFLERVGQGDAETSQNLAPQPISILEWKPK
jgi:hypothetical protein